MNSDTNQRILIVDDQSLILQALTLILEPFYTIVSALDGKQALSAAHEDPQPDLILLDVKMPEMDGHEVCRRLKADQDTRDIPVIFVTAMDRTRDEIHGFEVGAVDYIAKPIVQETLLARVRIHLALVENQRIIESRNAELAEMNQLNNKLIGMTAHDLRHPIESILGTADVLLSEQQLDTEDSRQHLDSISAACSKMLDLISVTLDVTAINSGELVLDPAPGSLADLTKERVSNLEPVARKKNIELVEHYDQVDDSSFDPNRIAQVLDKLISNAIKNSPEGTQVSVTLEEVDNQVKISVKDQGSGIPAEDQPGILDRIRQLWNKPTDADSGPGLELAIVNKIVDVHQGTMMVESSPGEGTTFAFTLPKDNLQS